MVGRGFCIASAPHPEFATDASLQLTANRTLPGRCGRTLTPLSPGNTGRERNASRNLPYNPPMLDPASILLLNLISTWFMVGLIWLVQLVHYRQFDLVGETSWLDYHRRHSTMITVLVAPAMLIEAASSIALVIGRPAAMGPWIAWAGLALVAVAWLSTALIQVPCHNKLSRGFDAAVCRSLTIGNWIRTIVWTARGVLMAGAMWQVLG